MANLEVRNCADCPFVLQTQEKLQAFAELKDKITKEAVDDNIDSVVAPALMEVMRNTPLLPDMPALFESEEDVAASIRMGAAAVLEQLDGQEESLTALVSAGTKLCGGPLKMRAAKAGVTTTVTVCNNPIEPMGEQIEDVVVRRRRA